MNIAKNGYMNNPSKCSYMVWGIDKSPDFDVELGHYNLSRVTTCKHMGVHLIENKHVDENTISTRIGAGRKPLLSFRGVGTHLVPAVPTVMNTIYNSMSLSRMLYGIEIIPLNQSKINTLEQAHLKHVKLIQSVPMNVATAAPLATIGQMSMRSTIALMKIMFLVRILFLPACNLYRKITLFILSNILSCEDVGDRSMYCISSPIADMWKYVKSYNLHDIFYDIMSGNVSNYQNIKSKIKNKIKLYDHYEMVCNMYPIWRFEYI